MVLHLVTHHFICFTFILKLCTFHKSVPSCTFIKYRTSSKAYQSRHNLLRRWGWKGWSFSVRTVPNPDGGFPERTIVLLQSDLFVTYLPRELKWNPIWWKVSYTFYSDIFFRLVTPPSMRKTQMRVCIWGYRVFPLLSKYLSKEAHITSFFFIPFSLSLAKFSLLSLIISVNVYTAKSLITD